MVNYGYLVRLLINQETWHGDAHLSTPGEGKVEAEGPGVQGHPRLHIALGACVGYVRHCLKQKQTKKKTDKKKEKSKTDIILSVSNSRKLC